MMMMMMKRTEFIVCVKTLLCSKKEMEALVYILSLSHHTHTKISKLCTKNHSQIMPVTLRVDCPIITTMVATVSRCWHTPVVVVVVVIVVVLVIVW